jgi:hypothetical protein
MSESVNEFQVLVTSGVHFAVHCPPDLKTTPGPGYVGKKVLPLVSRACTTLRSVKLENVAPTKGEGAAET